MALFKLPKDAHDVQEPELLPKDWYKLRITKEPELVENNARKEGGPDAPGAGFNIVLRLASVSDKPIYNGRFFTQWLSLPTEADKDKYTNQGQTIEDWKMDMIANVVAAFRGEKPSGNEIELMQGDEAEYFIIQEEYNGKLGNTIDRNVPPRAVS